MYRKTESGMIFGDYEDNRVFAVEELNINQRLGSNINTVEFIYTKDNTCIYLVEAKSSTPRESTDEARFKEFIDEVGNKFEHSFEILLSTYLKRQPWELPDGFTAINYRNVKFIFLFIINGHRRDWLPPVFEALNSRMRYYVKIWKCSVVVWNDEMAREFGLVKYGDAQGAAERVKNDKKK